MQWQRTRPCTSRLARDESRAPLFCFDFVIHAFSFFFLHRQRNDSAAFSPHGTVLRLHKTEWLAGARGGVRKTVVDYEAEVKEKRGSFSVGQRTDNKFR